MKAIIIIGNAEKVSKFKRLANPIGKSLGLELQEVNEDDVENYFNVQKVMIEFDQLQGKAIELDRMLVDSESKNKQLLKESEELNLKVVDLETINEMLKSTIGINTNEGESDTKTENTEEINPALDEFISEAKSVENVTGKPKRITKPDLEANNLTTK